MTIMLKLMNKIVWFQNNFLPFLSCSTRERFTFNGKFNPLKWSRYDIIAIQTEYFRSFRFHSKCERFHHAHLFGPSTTFRVAINEIDWFFFCFRCVVFPFCHLRVHVYDVDVECVYGKRRWKWKWSQSLRVVSADAHDVIRSLHWILLIQRIHTRMAIEESKGKKKQQWNVLHCESESRQLFHFHSHANKWNRLTHAQEAKSNDLCYTHFYN